jgi:hypothetical protein
MNNTTPSIFDLTTYTLPSTYCVSTSRLILTAHSFVLLTSTSGQRWLISEPDLAQKSAKALHPLDRSRFIRGSKKNGLCIAQSNASVRATPCNVEQKHILTLNSRSWRAY